ncbi:hypothetical protein RSOLAG22IIIB_07447 [Rhizoctonia solani]|uniref:Enoyl-CoA hydratase n=1 Tax=Rhizoctonia solani TaxID=456999 RepID=A0A0K6FNL9_9AGAM|nr:hypothetical protein RSOLAG22IIIB_07447 [Rhizoctonia solani]
MIAQEISIPLILQPQLFGAMSALSWIQCLYYSYHKTKIQCFSAYCIFLTFAGAFQGGFAVLAQRKYKNGDVWSLRIFALFSSILLSAGPQYWEIWKRKEVIGVSILFMIVDMLGGVFSALSLVFKETFDTFAAVPYLMVVALDALVIVLAMILNPLARRRRQRQASNEIAVEAQAPTDERVIPQKISTATLRASFERSSGQPTQSISFNHHDLHPIFELYSDLVMSDFSGNKLVKVTTPLGDSSVLLVELNRGPVNAFNQPFWEELGSTFDKISRDGTVRAVVLSSTNPKIFTAGLDLADTGSLANQDNLDPARQAVKLRDHILHFQSCISAIERCTQPVIAAVNGIAYGLAIDILCACDVRYSSSKTRFSIKEVDVGLAADIGTLSRLPKITGNESLLRELAFTAREFGPVEAIQLGMVSRVVEGGRDEVVVAALELAKTIAAKSPVALVGTKRFLLHARDHSVEQSLEYQATWNAAMLQSSDTTEAFKAFATKKPPRFNPLPKL